MSGDKCEIAPGLNVSRETRELLENYLSLVIKWNSTVNLISRNTIEDAWRRHVIDSAQLYSIACAPGGSWADFGSGAGFPGIVIGILGRGVQPPMRLTLVESDKRKAAFLGEASRQLGLEANVVNSRIESLHPIGAEVISARALAPLGKLLTYAHRHLAKDGTCLFLKGETFQDEVITARESWNFNLSIVPSATDESGVILKIQGLSNA